MQIKRFEFTAEQLKKLLVWQKHECPKKDKNGAIGGRFSYEFTPTGLGTAVVAKCMCGSEINLTEIGGW